LNLNQWHDGFTEEYKMRTDNQIDLEIALQKIHELAMDGGDLGYAYWYGVGQLLKRAAEMQAEINALGKELERCRRRRRARAALLKPDS
jgi:predicted lipase